MIRANLLDKAIAYVAPGVALQRARARYGLAVSGQFASGTSQYTGASQRGGLSTFNPRPGGPRGDALGALGPLRARSRDLERNNALAAGAIATVVTNVVGTGIFPIPRLDAQRLGLTPEKAAEMELVIGAEFDLCADSCEIDIAGDDDFYGNQDLVQRTTLVSGDSFTIPRYLSRPGVAYELCLQVLEADRCMNPDSKSDGTVMPGGAELYSGIESDRYGRPVAYWFSDRHPGETLQSSLRFERVPAYGNRSGRRNVLHHFRRLRPGQPRGIPYLAPVIQVLMDLGRYSEAEIVAAVSTACFALKTTTEEGDGADLSGGGEQHDAGYGDGTDDRMRYVNPGLVASMMPGESLESFLPNRPNQAFDPFVLAMLRYIGMALEIPYEVLIKHFTASYSAARAALLEAYKMFRARRAWLARSFCQPVYERQMIEAAALGRLPDMPGFFSDPARFKAWTNAEWIGPSAGQIDELKEVNAAKMRVEEEFSTREEETARLTGGDWRQKHRQRVIEERLRRADGTVMAAPPPSAAPAEDPAAEPPQNPDQKEAA
jgi:lambda family phage portal protein